MIGLSLLNRLTLPSSSVRGVTLLAAGMAGCMPLPGASDEPRYPVATRLTDQTLVADLGQADGGTIELLLADSKQARTVQASSGHQYELWLRVLRSGVFVDLEPAFIARVPGSVSRVLFTNLPMGRVYQAGVAGVGNTGPVRVTIDFATRPFVRRASASVNLALDILPPKEGNYQNPASPESGIAE